MPEPLAQPQDVADIWRPLTDNETTQVRSLILKASARVRQKTPFDIDARIELYATDPTNPIALDPDVVSDVVANIVKRVLVNPNGYLSSSETVGPYNRSGVFANRTGADGDTGFTMRVTDADVDQLRPAATSRMARTIRTTPRHVPVWPH